MGDVELTTIANVKLRLNITDSDSDTLLSELVLHVSSAIDLKVFGPNQIGFRTESNSIELLEEFHDGGCPSIILHRSLSNVPAERLEIVLLEDGVTLTQGADFQVDEFPARTVYRTSAADLFNRRFAQGDRNIQVTYKPAYRFAPLDIIRVANEETARAYLSGINNSTDGGFLVVDQRSTDAGQDVTYKPYDFSPMSLRILDVYKKHLSFF